MRLTSSPRNSILRRPITTTLELQKAGFLRGDSVDLRIRISHNKQVKSLHGIIITLYRQARVDMHPALPVVTEKGEDDIFPKSRTGLGGISFSAGGTSHLFRKDLDQTFAALIINPDTLAQEVKASVRIPEDAFPTVSTVPGAMISFKYFVEVILDLQGKLTGLDKYFGSAAASTTPGYVFATGLGASSSYSGPYSGFPHMINTEELRRERNVVHSSFEIVVGTKDSERNRSWKQPAMNSQAVFADVGAESSNSRSAAAPLSGASSSQETPWVNATTPYPESRISSRPLQSTDVLDHFPRGEAPRYEGLLAASYPLPAITPSEELSEKEVLRRAEEQLLPSQPLDAIAAGPSSAIHAPSAPALSDLQPILPHGVPVSNGLHFGFAPDVPSAPFLAGEGNAGPSAPAYSGDDPSSSTLPADDKQELERRRLEEQRSAPPEDPSETPVGTEAGPSAPMASQDFAPSAPSLADEDAFGFDAPDNTHALPRYER
jgi:hypothetical protein